MKVCVCVSQNLHKVCKESMYTRYMRKVGSKGYERSAVRYAQVCIRVCVKSTVRYVGVCEKFALLPSCMELQ